MAESANALDRRPGGSDALRAEYDGLAARRRPEDGRKVTAGAVQVWDIEELAP